jgi:hypothetical protein
MKQNLVIRDGTYFHLRIDGQWHKHQTWEEARRLLILADLDPHKMLASAIKVSEPMDIDYRPVGRYRWWLNGRPVPVAWVKYMLREAGCDKEVVDVVLHANKLIYEVGKNARERIVARR